MKEIRPAGNTPGASPQSDVVRIGCAKGDIKGLWQEGESVPPKARTRGRYLILLLPEITPSPKVEELHILMRNHALSFDVGVL